MINLFLVSRLHLVCFILYKELVGEKNLSKEKTHVILVSFLYKSSCMCVTQWCVKIQYYTNSEHERFGFSSAGVVCIINAYIVITCIIITITL